MAEGKDFCKSIWSQVEKGDVVLMAWQSLREIVEIELTKVEAITTTLDGRETILVTFDFCGHRFPRWSFDPEAVVYVRSRL